MNDNSRLFEAENEEKRNRDGRNSNVIKWQGANFSDEKFYVGSLDLNDPHSGAPIYTPSKQQLEDIETRERAARGQMEEFKQTGQMTPEPAPATQTNSSDTASSDSVFDSSGMSEEDLKTANEIYMRLMNEAAADEAARRAEIEAIKKQAEESEESEKHFNAATGSYSGLYGKKPMSDDEADVFANIMNSNNSYKVTVEDIIKEETDTK